MKTEEDEAFDDLAKRQGMWGGGFQAKRQMAADKQEPWNEDEWRRNNWRCGHGWLRGEQCEICNSPKQHMAADKLWDRPSVAFDEWWNGDNDESTNPFRLESGAYWAWAGWKAALAQPAQEQEEDWGALAEKQLASIKRDTQASFEGAMVRATHKVMAELEAQPAQEPVAFYRCKGCGHAYEQTPPTSCDCMDDGGFDRVEYFTAPPKREWVGLTDDDEIPWDGVDAKSFARAIEAKLKEKNT